MRKTCPTCGTKTSAKGVTLPDWKTLGPKWFCCMEHVIEYPPQLAPFIDERKAPGA